VVKVAVNAPVATFTYLHLQKKRAGIRPFLHQETLLVSVIRCIIVGVGFRRDFIIAFRDATVDGVELFVIHRLSNALQTHHVFIFRSTDEDHALGVTTHHADLDTRVRTSVPASVIIMIWSVIYLHRAHNGTVALGHLDRDNALRATRLGRVFRSAVRLP
jgi:hypothetical protein